jgi:hypothetical protein
MSNELFVSADNFKGQRGKHNLALEFFAAQNIRNLCDKPAAGIVRATCAQL